MIKSFNPAGWPRPKGYSNVISATGRLVSVAGQIGWDENEKFQSSDFCHQVDQALRNVVACLDAASAKPEHIVRMTWYITDKQAYLKNLAEVGTAYRQIIGKVYPTMSMVQVVALMEDQAKVEIEVTAIVPT